MNFFDSIIATLTNLQNVIMILGGIGTIVALILPFTQRDLLAPRLAAVAQRREELRKAALEEMDQKRQKQKSFTEKSRQVDFMGKVLDRLNLRKQLDSPEVRLQLARAGLRGQAPMVSFVFARLILPIIFGAAALVLLVSLKDLELAFGIRLLVVLGAAGFGFYVPGVFVQNLVTKRQGPIIEAFPDALDLLVICVEAGLSLEAAFTRVATNIAQQAPDLAEELGLATAELNFLGERRQALENLADRVNTDSVKSMAVALVQSEKYGTPLSVALRVLSRENRDSRLSKAEKKAGALPAMLTGPMIVFFLPTVFIVLLGPAVVQIMATF